MKNLNFIPIAVSVLAVILAIVALVSNPQVLEILSPGAASGTEHTNREYFSAGITQGGGVGSRNFTGNKAAEQLTAADFCDNSFLMLVAATDTEKTVYVPNKVQMGKCAGSGNRVGEWGTIFVYNKSTTTGSDFVITATSTGQVFYATNTSATIVTGAKARIDWIATSTDGVVSSSSVSFFITPY